MKTILPIALVSVLAVVSSSSAPYLLNDPVDVSGDFRDFANHIFTADKLGEFDAATAGGKIQYQRNSWQWEADVPVGGRRQLTINW
jgi:alpha-D-xyloside xylohydrolase